MIPTLRPMVGSRVLVVDDEQTVREAVAGYLSRDGFIVTEVGEGLGALDLIGRHELDLVILDLMLPDIGGLEVLRSTRTITDIPVVLLSARADETDRVLGLELGADDYVTKPFSPRELCARVRSVLRRTNPPPVIASSCRSMSFGDLSIDLSSREVTVSEQLIELTAREFELLHHLAASPRQVFSRAQLLEAVWSSSDEYQDPATVTVHVGRLRQKLERCADQPRWIATVWGIGYRFDP